MKSKNKVRSELFDWILNKQLFIIDWVLKKMVKLIKKWEFFLTSEKTSANIFDFTFIDKSLGTLKKIKKKKLINSICYMLFQIYGQ